MRDGALLKFKWYGRATLTANLPNLFSIGANTIQGTKIDVASPPLFNAATATDPVMSHAWGEFYNSYTVLASAIRVTAVNLKTDTEIIINVFPSSIQTPTHATTDIPPYPQSPYSRYKVMTPSTGSRGEVTIKHYQSTSKVFGVAHAVINANPNFSSQTAGANPLNTPSNTWFWLIAYTNAANLYTSHVMSFEIVQTMYVKLFNRNEDTNT